jgi:hypothetical protein
VLLTGKMPQRVLFNQTGSGPPLKLFYGWLCQDLVGGLGPDEGLAPVVPSVDEGPDTEHEISDGGKRAAVWMAWRSMTPNQTSTRFSHDPQVGVTWTPILGFAASQALTFGCLWAA